MADRITEFIRYVADANDKQVFDRYYYSGSSAVLSAEQETDLRRRISDHFEISMREVFLVGSAKIGCTLVHKPKRPPFSPFGDSSDVDIAIISERLFNKYWKEVFSYWADSGDWRKIDRFKSYLFRGWLRPDLMPIDTEFPISNDWFDFFRTLQADGVSGGYKISAGIYHGDDFWERYASTALTACRTHLEEIL